MSKSFGDDLRTRRASAGMSQTQLATAAGVDVRTIRNLEASHVKPSPDTLARLRGVPELGLEGEGSAELVPNAWFAPHLDALQLHRDMHDVLNGPGGSFEQTYLYLDGKSAADFIHLSTSAAYAAAFREAMPLRPAAERALQLAKGRGLDVHGLGTGDGRSETRFVQHLCDGRGEVIDVRLCLLDISPVMLSVAFRHAADLLDRRGVAVFALAGNFHELRRVPVMSYRPPGSRRLRIYTMLGCTGQNLENEVEWLRELHACAAPGDLLLIDLRLARAPSGDVAAIRAADPPLRDGPARSHFEWLSGPIERHCKGAGSVKFRSDLRPTGLVPGSYEIPIVAEVSMRDGSKREFTMLRLKSFEPKQLADFMRPIGWETELSMPYGVDGKPSTVMMLLRRV